MLETALLQKVKKKKFDEIEVEWLSRVESSPRDLPWFFALAREMRSVKAHAKMAELMTLLADGLGLEDAWEESFDVLAEGLSLVPRNKELRAKAVDLVRNRFPERPDLDEVIAFFDVESSDDPVRTFEELRDWLRFEPGAGFHLVGRGLGKVSEVNLALQKVQINFEKTAPLVMRRDEARKLLTWIPSDHFMMRRLEDPEGVRAEARSDPGSIMKELLHCFGRPLTAAEIRECMSGVVEGGQWTAWWAKAKSHPQVLPSKERRNAFQWSGTSEEAEQSVLAELANAPFRELLEMARRHAKRGGAVRREILERLGEKLQRRAPSRSSEALEIHLLLEELGEAPDPSPLDLDEVLRSSRAAKTIARVGDRRYREKLYSRVRDIRPDWPDVYRAGFLAESDFRLMTALYEGLRDHGPTGAAEGLVAESVSNPRKTPRPFVWVAKNVLRYEELAERANHSLLSKIIDALDHVEFKDLKAPLREQFETGGVVFTVFERSDRDAVDNLLNLIDSATALEAHRKTEIRRAIFRKYPRIRQRVEEDVIHATAPAVEAKRRELDQLAGVEIPENTQAIRIAREHGDLRENFEYHAARQKHEVLTSRAARLHEELKKVRLIDPAAVNPAKVGIGTRVQLQSLAGGSSRTAVILGPWDSDPDRGIYSYGSAFAKGFLGLRVDDTVEIDGGSYRIAHIGVWTAPDGPGEGASATSHDGPGAEATAPSQGES